MRLINFSIKVEIIDPHLLNAGELGMATTS